MIYNYIDLKKNALRKEDLAGELSEMKNENEKLKQRLDNFLVEYEIQKSEIPSSNKNESFSALKKTEMEKADEKNSTENNLQKKTILYTVKPGDSLDKIVREFYKTESGLEIVMKQNNLKKKTDIRIGQVLEIPQFSK
jgi:LysM repeat protein